MRVDAYVAQAMGAERRKRAGSRRIAPFGSLPVPKSLMAARRPAAIRAVARQ